MDDDDYDDEQHCGCQNNGTFSFTKRTAIKIYFLNNMSHLQSHLRS